MLTQSDYAIAFIRHEEQIAMLRMDLARKAYLFEADREKDILAIRLNSAKKIQEELEKQYKIAPTAELLSELELIDIEIKSIVDNLEKIPQKKFSEALNGLTAITNELSRIDGILGDIFSEVGGQLKNVRTAFDDNVGKGAGAGAATGAVIGSVVPVIGSAIGAVAGAIIGGLAGLFGGRKKKVVDDGLLSVFPELIDGVGNLNKELAQALINTSQVDANTKQLLQNAIDWAGAVEEANRQIKDIVVELAGDLGNSLRKNIVDAWKSGEDAASRMFDAASRSLENFTENLIWSLLTSDIFKEFENRMADTLKFGGDIKRTTIG